MKIKCFSWILADAYLLLGILSFLNLTRYRGVFSGFLVAVPFVARTVMVIGPSGWLCSMIAIGAIVLLKDLRFQWRALGSILTIVFVLFAAWFIVAVLVAWVAVANDA